jgi:hypothetical protein
MDKKDIERNCSTACDLDYSNIDDWDERSGDDQLALIWCDDHGRWAWVWLPVQE